VAEPSLAYQSVVQIEWTLLGSVWLGMSGLGSGLSREPHGARGGPLVIWTDAFGETSAGTLQTRENR
jgi:hypothetical protein